jgi:glycosyltransferase involved in cell wall biosynthesis
MEGTRRTAGASTICGQSSRWPAMIYADQRWIGHHGIGRFARHVLAGLDYRPVPLASNPAAPLDSWFLGRALGELTRNDLFFSPGYNTPLYCPCPFVFTIHDLSHIYCPENRSLFIRLYYATIMKRACHRAAFILTVSEFTRGQIVDWSGAPAEKVFNVGCGVDPAYRPEGDSYGLPFPYLLCVSNRKRHKNELRVVEAFGKASLDPGIHLVFTGERTADLKHFIQAQQVSARVDFMGVVEEEKLPSLYRGSEALIFPSLYEGFGLPVLEAMACGTPVVTANVTAMPEVAGDAALLVDPTSIEQIARAMEQVVDDTLLRQRLRERARARAAQFSWARSAAKVHKLLAGSSSQSLHKDNGDNCCRP